METPAIQVMGNGDHEAGSFRTALAIILLGLAVFATMGFGWLAIQDRLNGLDAYRTTELRKQRDNYFAICEENSKNFAILIEWQKQQKTLPPPNFMVMKTCIQPESVEKQKE